MSFAEQIFFNFDEVQFIHFLWEIMLWCCLWKVFPKPKVKKVFFYVYLWNLDNFMFIPVIYLELTLA